MKRQFTPKLLSAFILLTATGRHFGCKQEQERPQPSKVRTASTLRVLYPTDGCTWPAQALQIVAVTDDLGAKPEVKLDNKPLEVTRMIIAPRSAATQPASASKPAHAKSPASQSEGLVLVAAAQVAPGPHVLTAGQSELRFAVQQPASSKSDDAKKSTFHIHPPPAPKMAECSVCHTVTDSPAGKVLHRPKMPDSCMQCHDQEDFELDHMHRVEVLVNCQMCHEPHGSTADQLLKGDPQVLCTDCHE